MSAIMKVLAGAVLGAAATVAALGYLMPPSYSKAEIDAIVRDLRGAVLQPASLYGKSEIDGIVRDLRAAIPQREGFYSRSEVDDIVRDLRAVMPPPGGLYTRSEVDRLLAPINARLAATVDALPHVVIRTSKNDIPTHLFFNERTIPGFTTAVRVRRAGVALIDFHCDVEHRNIVSGVIGVGARLWYRHAGREEDLQNARQTAIPGAVSGTNILDATHHYGQIIFHAAVKVEPGWYLFEVRMGSHSSLAPGRDGLARINPGSGGDAYNTLRVVVIEGAQFGK
jgi:hypothetical protein